MGKKARARLGTWSQPVWHATVIALLALLSYFVASAISTAYNIDRAPRVVVEAGVMVVCLGILELFVVGRPQQRVIEATAEANYRRESKLVADAARQEFEGRLARALDMAQNEEQALDMIDRGLAVAAGGHQVEMLLADSSRAHLVRAAGAGVERACSVESPRDCVAVRRGQTLIFSDSEDLDACPYLRGRESACSAVCVPVNVLGNTVGVLHAVGEPGLPPTQEVAFGLETVSTQAGTRIGMLRALHRSEIQAATDPLTGLLNRRSVEDRLHQLMREDRAFALAMCDLDNFKLLNDTHGHEAGDRALRLFASTLKTSLRPTDVSARYGGEEFLLVFPDASAEAARAAVERLREELALAVNRGGTPVFTASFGVADFRHGATIDEMMKSADDALLLAKREGKNRVLVAVDGGGSLDALDAGDTIEAGDDIEAA